MTVASVDTDQTKIRLLIVCTTLSRGGAERDIANFANHLDRRQYEIDIAPFTGKKEITQSGRIKLFG